MSKKKSESKINRDKKRKTLSVVIWSILGAALLLLAAFLFYPKQDTVSDLIPEVDGSPSLEADMEQIDFGDVRFNEFVTASFELTNVGDESLRFTQQPYVELKAGC
jgi:hypothetical protein